MIYLVIEKDKCFYVRECKETFKDLDRLLESMIEELNLIEDETLEDHVGLFNEKNYYKWLDVENKGSYEDRMKILKESKPFCINEIKDRQLIVIEKDKVFKQAYCSRETFVDVFDAMLACLDLDIQTVKDDQYRIFSQETKIDWFNIAEGSYKDKMNVLKNKRG